MVMSLANTGQAARGGGKALRFNCAEYQVLVWRTAGVALEDVGLRDVEEPGALLTAAQKGQLKLWERREQTLEENERKRG